MGYNTMFEHPEVYDTFYSDKAYEAETEMMVEEIEATTGGADRVLVVGVGTGNHLPGLEAAGYDIVGIDESEQMLDAARDAHPGVTFRNESFPDVSVEGPFDAVLFPFSVVHFLSDDDLVDGIEEIDELLAPDGVVILDILENRTDVEVQLTVRRTGDADYCFLTKVIPESETLDRYKHVVLTDQGAERGAASFDVFNAEIVHHPWLASGFEELGYDVQRHEGYGTDGWLDDILEVLVCRK